MIKNTDMITKDALTTGCFQIYWLKDRVEIQPDRDPNYIQAADGHLIIIQTKAKDNANFTCVAENVSNRRLSPVARLQVVGKANKPLVEGFMQLEFHPTWSRS